MKKLLLAISIGSAILCAPLIAVIPASAETVTQIGNVTFTLIDIFSIEFFMDSKVLYGENLPFGTIDYSKLDDQHTYVYPIGRSENDGKSDTGVICRTNLNLTWYLKIQATPISSPAFPMEYFLFYMGQPYNRNTGAESDGSRTYTDGEWHPVPTSSSVVYTAGSQDKSNLPDGTLSTFSFAIWPLDLPAGTTYQWNITYTLSATLD